MDAEQQTAATAQTEVASIARQLLALVVQARRISAMVGKLPDGDSDAAKRAAEAA
ncbi:hypothetical protein [Rhizobium binxianense]